MTEKDWRCAICGDSFGRRQDVIVHEGRTHRRPQLGPELRNVDGPWDQNYGRDDLSIPWSDWESLWKTIDELRDRAMEP